MSKTNDNQPLTADELIKQMIEEDAFGALAEYYDPEQAEAALKGLLQQRDTLLVASKAFVTAWSLPNGSPTSNCIGRNRAAYDQARAAIAAVEKGT